MLRYDHKKYPFQILLRHTLCRYLLTSHYVTDEKVSKQYPPQKMMYNLKTLLPRNFGGVFNDLLPYQLARFITE